MSLSLINILKNDADFQRRLAAKVNNVREDKLKIVSCAESYSKKYEKEVEAGEQLRQNLLTEATMNGLDEKDIYIGRGFFPTKRTPILNMLYFLLRESNDDQIYGENLYGKRDQLNEYLKRTYATEDNINENDPALLEEIEKLIRSQTKPSEVRENVNKKFVEENSNVDDLESKEIEDVSEFLYGNLTLDQFNKIKKLKALSQSSNESEAFQAYRKALELCKEYGLEFDKIPCYVKK